MSIFKDWGFTSNPFKPDPLKGNEQGFSLLIGRDDLKKQLKKRLKSNAGIVTIEGENGIGKTSLINVSLFEMYNHCIKEKTTEFYVPCIESFQLTRDTDVNEFTDNILYSVAQTLIKHQTSIKRIKKLNPELKHVDTWLNLPETQSFSAQIMAFGAGETREINTSGGYLKSGFKKQILDWLNTLFPSSDFGGVVCTIDNLELLKTSDKARETIEFLRDTLFTLNGLKWIFSGSHGIIQSIVGSPRMSGYLMEPINIKALSSAYVLSVMNTRIESFQNHVDDKPYLPILDEDFIELYKSQKGNLRETLNKLSSYCLFVSDLPEDPYFDKDKMDTFQKWYIKDQKMVLATILRSCSVKDLNLLKFIHFDRDSPDTTKIKSIGYKKMNEVLESVDKLNSHGLIAIPIYEQLDIEQLQNDYGIIEIDDKIADDLFDDYLFKVFINVNITPKGYYVANTFL